MGIIRILYFFIGFANVINTVASAHLPGKLIQKQSSYVGQT